MNLSHERNSSKHLPVKKRARNSDSNSDRVAFNKTRKLSLTSKNEGEVFSDPPKHFVLCGRGERTNRHSGNKAFRRLVDVNKPLYHSSDRRKKGLIAKSIVHAIYGQDPPGRFVREEKKSGLWLDVGMKEAIKKTSQALREYVQEKKEGKNDKPHHEDDKSETETDDSEFDDEDSNHDRDGSQKNTSHPDGSWPRAVVSYDTGDSSREEEEEEEEDNGDEFSSQEHDDYEGFKHVVFADLDILPKDPLHSNVTEVPHPPVFTHETSDWTLRSFGSVFEDTVAGVPSPSALTFGTSNWTFKNVMVHEEPGVLIPPALTSHASDWTFKSMSSVFSDGAHSNDAGETVKA